MNYISDVELKAKNRTYNIIVEIPKGTNNKFELVEPTNDRVECVRKVIGKYPFCYGCFPKTYAGDKDPLDVILLTKRKYKSLDIVNVQVIGVIKTIDFGEVDDKILAIPVDEPIEHLDKLEKKAMKFLKSYKGKDSKMQLDETIYDFAEAEKLIQNANQSYTNRLIIKHLVVRF